jgi:nucleoid-associated protein YgaU
VQPGDRLSDIAAEFGLSWREIVQANRELLANPDRLEIGWRLLIP